MCSPGCDDGCGCGYVIASAIYHSQRLALCCAATSIALCLLITLLVTGGVGVGVGYHYCVVESKTYELELEQFKKSYNSTPKAGGGSDKKDSLRIGSEITEQEHPEEQEYEKDLTTTLVESQRLEDKGLLEQLAQKVKSRKMKRNPRIQHRHTTWLYKDMKQQSIYTERNKTQRNKYNKTQKLSLLLSKLELFNNDTTSF